MTKPGNAILKLCAPETREILANLGAVGGRPVAGAEQRGGGGSDIHRTLAKGFDSRREVFASIRRL